MRRIDRRRFLTVAGIGAVFPHELGRLSSRALDQQARGSLPTLSNVSADRLELVARPAPVDAGGTIAEAWTLNGSSPAPTIRLRRGDRARIELRNELSEQTILHWHGLDVPEAADGHPRLAIDPGQRYSYEFEVVNRAGTYWYHPHTHRRTALQTYRGMAGLLIVEDDEEAALELPDGEHEIALVLQDKRLEGSGAFDYRPIPHDHMMGFLGDTGFANGAANPRREVGRGVYRLRVLNASNARILDLGMSTRAPMTLIGADGGLLERPGRVERVMLGTGERADLLVDFSDHQPGERVRLRSLPFEIQGMMGGMMASGRGMGRGRGRGTMNELVQGRAMDMVEFVVTDTHVDERRPLPPRLARLPTPVVPTSVRVRTLRFNSSMMSHTINGRSFELDRVDERIGLGETEVWTLVNESPLPHPIHVHAGQFRVLSRSGGRGRVMPWESGLKDTVLTLPGEEVDIAVRFDRHEGLFLLHCHNLEHEDMGMMMNFEVVSD